MKIWRPGFRTAVLYLLFALSAVLYVQQAWIPEIDAVDVDEPSQNVDAMKGSPLPEIILPETPDFVP